MSLTMSDTEPPNGSSRFPVVFRRKSRTKRMVCRPSRCWFNRCRCRSAQGRTARGQLNRVPVKYLTARSTIAGRIQHRFCRLIEDIGFSIHSLRTDLERGIPQRTFSDIREPEGGGPIAYAKYHFRRRSELIELLSTLPIPTVQGIIPAWQNQDSVTRSPAARKSPTESKG